MTIKKIAKGIGYLIIRAIGLSLGYLFFSLKRVGRENIPREGSYILVSNHMSYLDPIAVQSISRKQLRFFMLAEWYYNKRWKWIYDFFGCIPVEKGMINTSSIDKAVKAISNGDPFVIFPEGGISMTGKIGKWHSGVGFLALSTGVPVIPVLIKGTADALPVDTYKLHARPVTVFAGKQIMFKTKDRASLTRQEIRQAAQKIRDAFIELTKEKGLYNEIVGPEAEQERLA